MTTELDKERLEERSDLIKVLDTLEVIQGLTAMREEIIAGGGINRSIAEAVESICEGALPVSPLTYTKTISTVNLDVALEGIGSEILEALKSAYKAIVEMLRKLIAKIIAAKNTIFKRGDEASTIKETIKKTRAANSSAFNKADKRKQEEITELAKKLDGDIGEKLGRNYTVLWDAFVKKNDIEKAYMELVKVYTPYTGFVKARLKEYNDILTLINKDSDTINKQLPVFVKRLEDELFASGNNFVGLVSKLSEREDLTFAEALGEFRNIVIKAQHTEAEDSPSYIDFVKLKIDNTPQLDLRGLDEALSSIDSLLKRAETTNPSGNDTPQSLVSGMKKVSAMLQREAMSLRDGLVISAAVGGLVLVTLRLERFKVATINRALEGASDNTKDDSNE